MKLSEENILEMCNKVRDGEATKFQLKELLGGTKLSEILDNSSINILLDSLINNGKIYNTIENDNGIQMLEGLLNNKIKGDISNFYLIRPEYVLQLPKKEKKHMADCVSNNKKELSLTLQKLWEKGIETQEYKSLDKQNNPVLQIYLKKYNFKGQDYIQNIYQLQGIDAMGTITDGGFKISLSGDNLYNYISKEVDENLTVNKENIFLDIAKNDYLDYESMYNYFVNKNDKCSQENTKVILDSDKECIETIEQREKERVNQNIDGYPAKQNKFTKLANQIRAKFINRFQKDKLNYTENEAINMQTEENKTIKSWELDEKQRESINKLSTEINNQYKQQVNHEKELATSNFQDER